MDPGNSFNSGDLMLDITKDANDNIQKASIYQFSSIVKVITMPEVMIVVTMSITLATGIKQVQAPLLHRL